MRGFEQPIHKPETNNFLDNETRSKKRGETNVKLESNQIKQKELLLFIDVYERR